MACSRFASANCSNYCEKMTLTGAGTKLKT